MKNTNLEKVQMKKGSKYNTKYWGMGKYWVCEFMMENIGAWGSTYRWIIKFKFG